MAELSLIKGFTATLTRDLMIAYRRKGDFANPLIFFLIRMIRFLREIAFGFVFPIFMPNLLILI